jgi:proline dehydrogenase
MLLLLIDGEESWMQDAADDLVTEMMRKYNKEKSNCFQYIANVSLGSLDYLKNYTRQNKDGFFRYEISSLMLTWKRNCSCRRKGYPSLCASKEATDENYDAAVHYMIDNLDLMSILQEPTMS